AHLSRRPEQCGDGRYPRHNRIGGGNPAGARQAGAAAEAAAGRVTMSKAMTMTLDEFRHLLDTAGSDVSRWPEAARTRGERLIETDAAALRAYENARRLDALIESSVRRGDQVQEAASGRALAA